MADFSISELSLCEIRSPLSIGVQKQHVVTWGLPVSAQHEANWSVRIAVGYVAPWGVRSAQWHVVPIGFGAITYTVFPYSGVFSVGQRWNEARYRIMNTVPVARWTESKYGLRAAPPWLEAPYSVMTRARGQNEAGYRIRNTQQASSWHQLRYSFRLAKDCAAAWAITLPIRVQNEVRYGISNTTPIRKQHSVVYAVRVVQDNDAVYSVHVPVRAQNEIDFKISSTQPVRTQHQTKWAMRVGQFHQLDYVFQIKARQGFSSPYAIKVTAGAVQRQHEARWGLKTTSQHTILYAPLLPAKQQNVAGYRIFSTAAVESWYNARYALRVSKQHEAVHALLWKARQQNEARYGIKATTTVRAQHEVRYRARAGQWNEVRYSFSQPIGHWTETPYAMRAGTPISLQHGLRWSLRVARASEYPYGFQTRLEEFKSFPYAIKNTQPVRTQMLMPWSLRTARSFEAGYLGLVKTAASMEARYSVIGTAKASQWNSHRYGLRVSAQSEVAWAINTKARQQSISPYSGIGPTAGQIYFVYEILGYEPARSQTVLPYALQDYFATLVQNTMVRVTLADGTTFRVDDAVIDSAEGDIGYSFECAITDVNLFARIKEDDPLVVDFCGDQYYFLVVSKSFTRNSGVDVSFRIKADNAVVRLGTPYARETDYIQEEARMASQLVNDLIPNVFSYEIADWLIPARRLQAAGATVLEAVKQIAEAPGGVVDGTQFGYMRIRYPYPYAMNALNVAPVDQYYSEDYDNLSVSVNTEYRDNANRFRIREGDASFSDSMEWVPDEEQPDPKYETGIVKAYLSPYRTTATIKHLGNATKFQPLPEQVEFNEELIEFNEGVGNTQRPIHELLSVEWYTADMGHPAFTPYSTVLNVDTLVNSGYGIAKVTYNAKYLAARASGIPANTDAYGIGPASSYAYFILEESNGN